MRHLLTLDDLSDAEIDAVLDRARRHASTPVDPGPPFDLALLFLDPSLRTRSGFHVAAGRLGGRVVDVSEARWQPGMSGAESFADTLRAVTGIVDVAVVRRAVDLGAVVADGWAAASIVNAGDLGHHPSQALIDIDAIESRCGPIGGLKVAVVGDLGMRATSSFLAMLRRRPPGQLVLVAPSTRLGGGAASEFGERRGSIADVAEVDAVYVGGLPEGEGAAHLDAAERRRYQVDGSHLDRWGPDVAVFSPMPVIDEVAVEARQDPRVRMYEQSDAAVFVRMAVLELLLGRLDPR